VDKLYTVRFREVSGLSRFKNFKNKTTGCGDTAYCVVGYFILNHPVVQLKIPWDLRRQVMAAHLLFVHHKAESTRRHHPTAPTVNNK